VQIQGAVKACAPKVWLAILMILGIFVVQQLGTVQRPVWLNTVILQHCNIATLQHCSIWWSSEDLN